MVCVASDALLFGVRQTQVPVVRCHTDWRAGQRLARRAGLPSDLWKSNEVTFIGPSAMLLANPGHWEVWEAPGRFPWSLKRDPPYSSIMCQGYLLSAMYLYLYTCVHQVVTSTSKHSPGRPRTAAPRVAGRGRRGSSACRFMSPKLVDSMCICSQCTAAAPGTPRGGEPRGGEPAAAKARKGWEETAWLEDCMLT